MLSTILGITGASGNPTNKAASQVQQNLLSLLNNESVTEISSLQLNQFASLTYHEDRHSTGDDDLTEVIFETVHGLLSRAMTPPTLISPLPTPLSLTKACIVARHVLLTGSDKVVPEARRLVAVCTPIIQHYNTALLQQHYHSFTFRLAGGAVDQGGPVREAATEVLRLLSLDEVTLQHERSQHASATSLVPVGSDSVGVKVLLSEQERFRQLQQTVQHQEQMQLKSNLKMANNGFGGGYSSQDGKAVVGAAHGLEEMQKMAERATELQKQQEMAFSDAASQKNTSFADYQAPTTEQWMNPNAAMQQRPKPTHQLQPAAPVDFLSMAAANAASSTCLPPATTGDLLGFSSPGSIIPPAPSTAASDLLSLAETTLATPAVDPFAPVASPEPPAPPSSFMNSASFTPAILAETKKDPFSAFDGLGLQSNAADVPVTSKPSLTTNQPADSFTSLDAESSVTAALSMPTQVLAPTSTTLSASGMQGNNIVATGGNNDEDNPWVMGGSAGSGLNPVGAAPAAPPPPPPPGSF